VQAKLRYVCSPPGMRGCVNVALPQELLGEWQFAHVVP
jgi:hypothetical protein